jgi:hypothetical protein
MFRAADAKAEPALALEDVLFITEYAEHVRAARLLGLQAVRVSTPGRTDGEVEDLRDLLPRVYDLVGDGAERRRAADSGAERATGTWTLLGQDLVVRGSLRGTPAAAARAAPIAPHACAACRRVSGCSSSPRTVGCSRPTTPTCQS